METLSPGQAPHLREALPGHRMLPFGQAKNTAFAMENLMCEQRLQLLNGPETNPVAFQSRTLYLERPLQKATKSRADDIMPLLTDTPPAHTGGQSLFHLSSLLLPPAHITHPQEDLHLQPLTSVPLSQIGPAREL